MNLESCILKLVDEISHLNPEVHLNERYLHHLFSRLIQPEFPVSLDVASQLHPEWATYIANKRCGGCYRIDNGKYRVASPPCHSGFIDFAIGNADRPDYAVEFKMSTRFNAQGLIFDYMKLLDSRNLIGRALSVSVYYGHSSHSDLCEAGVLSGCVKEAIWRLGRYVSRRNYRFIFLEIIDGKIVNQYECLNSPDFKIISTREGTHKTIEYD